MINRHTLLESISDTTAEDEMQSNQNSRSTATSGDLTMVAQVTTTTNTEIRQLRIARAVNSPTCQM